MLEQHNRVNIMENTEQLKMILDVIGETTDSAKWILLAWLSIDLAKVMACWAGGVMLCKVIIKPIFGLFAAHTFGVACRDAVMPKYAGSELTSREKIQVLELIQLGLQASRYGWKPPEENSQK